MSLNSLIFYLLNNFPSICRFLKDFFSSIFLETNFERKKWIGRLKSLAEQVNKIATNQWARLKTNVSVINASKSPNLFGSLFCLISCWFSWCKILPNSKKLNSMVKSKDTFGFRLSIISFTSKLSNQLKVINNNNCGCEEKMEMETPNCKHLENRLNFVNHIKTRRKK